MNVNLTENAIDRIDELCVEHPGEYVRLSILSGGCHGFSKVFDFTSSINEDDLVVQCYSGKLIIDSISLNILKNSTIDYKKDLMGSYFVIDIPNSSNCGCGSSFDLI